MKSKSRTSINQKNILIYVLLVIVGFFIGIVTPIAIKNLSSILNENQSENQEIDQGKDVKKSPYTLEELYEIVENPNLFYEKNNTNPNDYNMTMFNFYDYFNKSTPVKIASKVKKDEEGKVLDVIEVKYLTYDEYLKATEDAREVYSLLQKSLKEQQEEYDYDYELDAKYSFDFRYWIELLVYGSATEA